MDMVVASSQPELPVIFQPSWGGVRSTTFWDKVKFLKAGYRVVIRSVVYQVESIQKSSGGLTISFQDGEGKRFVAEEVNEEHWIRVTKQSFRRFK